MAARRRHLPVRVEGGGRRSRRSCAQFRPFVERRRRRPQHRVRRASAASSGPPTGTRSRRRSQRAAPCRCASATLDLALLARDERAPRHGGVCALRTAARRSRSSASRRRRRACYATSATSIRFSKDVRARARASSATRAAMPKVASPDATSRRFDLRDRRVPATIRRGAPFPVERRGDDDRVSCRPRVARARAARASRLPEALRRADASRAGPDARCDQLLAEQQTLTAVERFSQRARRGRAPLAARSATAS